MVDTGVPDSQALERVQICKGRGNGAGDVRSLNEDRLAAEAAITEIGPIATDRAARRRSRRCSRRPRCMASPRCVAATTLLENVIRVVGVDVTVLDATSPNIVGVAYGTAGSGNPFRAA